MQITEILAQMGGLQSMARELGVSETQAANGAEALIPAILGGFKKQAQSQPAGLDGLGRLARAARRRRPARRRAGAAADGRESRQRRTRSDLRFQGREPHGRAERGFAVGTRSVPAQEDAADAGNARRRLHGEATERRRRSSAFGIRRRARRHAGEPVRRPERRHAPGSARCST